MANTETTITSAGAWSPDQNSFAAGDVVPDALIMQHSTLAGRIEGDAPMIRVAYVTDDEADFVAEGTAIDEADPALSEVTVATGKVAQLLRLSREQYVQEGAATELSESVRRAVVKKANSAFLAQTAPVGPAVTPPAGILNIGGIITGDPLTDDLDALVDLVAQLQANGGTPSAIVLDPLGWAALRKIKTSSGSAVTLLGAGTDDTEPRLLGIPVAVTPAMTQGTGLVLDKTAIVSAIGDVQVKGDESVYFASDSVAIRATWRIGWNLVRPNRIGTFTIGSAESSSSSSAG